MQRRHVEIQGQGMGEYTVLKLEAERQYDDAAKKFLLAATDLKHREKHLGEVAHKLILHTHHAIKLKNEIKVEIYQEWREKFQNAAEEKGVKKAKSAVYSELKSIAESLPNTLTAEEVFFNEASKYLLEINEYNELTTARNNLLKRVNFLEKRMNLLRDLDIYGGEIDETIAINKKLLQLSPDTNKMNVDERQAARDKLSQYLKENPDDASPHVREFVAVWLEENG